MSKQTIEVRIRYKEVELNDAAEGFECSRYMKG